ncbi:hypothetical protein D3C84_870730 [compost metagenome]
MAVLARQQVVGLMVQLPPGFFVGNAFTQVLGTAQQQVFGLGQAHHPAAINLVDSTVGRFRQHEVPTLQIVRAAGAAKAHSRQIGQVGQRTAGQKGKGRLPNVVLLSQAGHGSKLLAQVGGIEKG